MPKIDLEKRKTIKTVAKAVYTAPLTMTLLTSKRALAQSPPCDERITIVSVTADPASLGPRVQPDPNSEVILTCNAKSFDNSSLSYTWNTGYTGSVVRFPGNLLSQYIASDQDCPLEKSKGYCNGPFIVTVSDGTCSVEGSVVIYRSTDDTIPVPE